MSNNKLGLYAQYSKIDGSFIDTKIMKRSDAYKSNKDSSRILSDLLTESETKIYDYPQDRIPKVSKNWEPYVHHEGIECDLCGNFYPESEMAQIENENEGINCSICIHCNDD